MELRSKTTYGHTKNAIRSYMYLTTSSFQVDLHSSIKQSIIGGRFREFYYWDTFWILKGLLFSEMYETARGVILNLAYMVDQWVILIELV